MLSCVKDIEKNCEDVLKYWTGNMEQIRVVEKYVRKFIEGGYAGIVSI